MTNPWRSDDSAQQANKHEPNLDKAGVVSEFRRGAAPLAAAFGGVLIGVMVLHLFTAGILMPPLRAEFGWTRGELSVASAIMTAIGAISAPFVGALVDRFGAQRIATISLLAAALGFWMLSRFSGSLGAYLALTAVVGIGGAGTSVVTYLSLVNRWFVRARGIAIGLVLAASGLAGALAPQLMAPLVAKHGWRAGYEALALVMLIGAPVIAALAHERPKIKSAEPRTVAEHSTEEWGMTLAQARATSRFWRLGAAFFLIATAITGLIVHFVPMLIDSGLDSVRAGSITATIGLSVIFGRILAGWLLDRTYAPYTAAVFILLAAAGCFGLAIGGASAAPFAALMIGFAMGAEVDINGYMTARYFGTRCYGSIYGWQYGMFAAGGIASPVILGAIFDMTHNYNAALLFSGATLLASTPLLLFMGRYPLRPALSG